MSLPRAIYAGTFDPITVGHVALIERASRLMGGLLVAVGSNVRKQTWFDAAERLEMVRAATAHLPAVTAETFEGLLVDFATARFCTVLVRGIRGLDDYTLELKNALTNRVLAPGIETVWLVADPATAFVSSSMVRELVSHGGDPTPFVPPGVVDRLRERRA